MPRHSSAPGGARRPSEATACDYGAGRAYADEPGRKDEGLRRRPRRPTARGYPARRARISPILVFPLGWKSRRGAKWKLQSEDVFQMQCPLFFFFFYGFTHYWLASPERAPARGQISRCSQSGFSKKIQCKGKYG